MVSCYEAGSYDAQLVRTVCGDVYPMGGGFEEIELDSPINGSYDGREQSIEIGSWAEVGGVSIPESFTFEAWVFPTTPGAGRRQTLVSTDELTIGLSEEGSLSIDLDGSPVDTGVALPERRWTRVAVSRDLEASTVTLIQEPQARSPGDRLSLRRIEVVVPLLPIVPLDPANGVLPSPGLRFADRTFNGRLEAPRLIRGVLDSDGLDALSPDDSRVVGWWDFSRGIATDGFEDLSPHGRHGVLHNLPTRAVPGRRWTGEIHDWKQAPEQYGAVHFHDDDLADAEWDSDFELTIPDHLESGIYAVRLRRGRHEDHIQFFVRPPRGEITANLLFLVPTATYLAYANHTIHLRPSHLTGEPPAEPLPNDATLLSHPEFGLSHYDYHRDGSGVVFSSRRRPVMNLKSKNVPWGFAADTRLTAWLEREGIAYDIATDEDLDEEGSELLSRYRAVMTGTHPEYWSTRMLDALESRLEEGGRLLYMGGNGFYWRVAFDRDHEGVMEVRRAEDGTRAWLAEPGESYHQWGGEYGGLWRRIGRPPNLLCGVGFAAQGFGHTVGFERTEASDDPRAAFLFDGVNERRFGDHRRLDSPSGEEIDRFDIRLGSPPHALVVATATDQPAEMLKTKEEFHETEIATAADPQVRNDVVFFECPNGGAVFSTGSINWGAALATDGGKNDVARITRNAVDRFLHPEPFRRP